jgi:Protein of unknown function (DUF3604)
MQRQETYATTGSRLVVRFFGGWDFAAGDATSGKTPTSIPHCARSTTCA